MDTSCTTDGRF